MARVAVGLLALTNFIVEATVRIGWRGRSSKSRTAVTEAVPLWRTLWRTRARSSATRANNSRAEAMASSAIVVIPSRK
jgi:hypothetical protein